MHVIIDSMDMPSSAPGSTNNQSDTAALHFRWLGVAGIELAHENEILLIDPFLTRPSLGRVLFDRLKPNHELIKARLNRSDNILVTHAHYDHLMDVPDIAKHSRAIIFGSPNTCKLLRAWAIPDQQIREIHAGDTFEIGSFLIHVLAAQHGKMPGFSSGHVREGLVPPLRSWEYVMDVDYSFLIQAGGLKILDWSGVGREGAPVADVLFMIPDSQPGFCEGLIASVQPQLVVPIHWDDMFRPLNSQTHLSFELPRWALPPLKRFDLGRFYNLVKRVSPQTEIIIPKVFELHNLDRFVPKVQ